MIAMSLGLKPDSHSIMKTTVYEISRRCYRPDQRQSSVGNRPARISIDATATGRFRAAIWPMSLTAPAGQQSFGAPTPPTHAQRNSARWLGEFHLWPRRCPQQYPKSGWLLWIVP